MKKLLALLVVLILSSVCHAFDDGDFQYWSNYGIDWKVKKDWKLNVNEELRFGDDAGTLWYKHTELGFTYSGLADWLDVGAAYRYISLRGIKAGKISDWSTEHRPNVNFTLKSKLGNTVLSSRSKFEFRERNGSEDEWRYRNKFTVKLPYELPFKFKPYIADEIYVNFEKESFTRNRIYTGVGRNITKDLSVNIFYLWQTSRSSNRWTDANVIGGAFKLKF